MERNSEAHPVRITVIRYVDQQGRRCHKSTPGARRVKKMTRSYYAYLPSRGRPERIPLKTRDIHVAWERLRKILLDRRDDQLGIRRPQEDELLKPLSHHLNDWQVSLRAAGRTGEKQIGSLLKALTTLAELAGWNKLGDLDAESCLRALDRLQNEQRRSAQTRNHYLAHARQFGRWCASGVGKHRLQADPFSGLMPVNIEVDRRHIHRTPKDEEIATLLEYLDGRGKTSPPSRCGMSAAQRALGYRVSMATGYRATELRSLRSEHFDLSNPNSPTVSLSAAIDKRRRRSRPHPLPSWLGDMLRTWFLHGGACWDGFPENYPGRLLKADVISAGLEYEVEGLNGPEYLDFHSLRHWYCTVVTNLPGISPRTVLALTRHSCAELAMKIYGQSRTESTREAAEQIPKPGSKT